jgi:hypothetical protein
VPTFYLKSVIVINILYTCTIAAAWLHDGCRPGLPPTQMP